MSPARAQISAGGQTTTTPLDADVDQLEELRALVTLSRTHPTDFKQREVIVRIDGGPKHQLLYGETETIEVQPGRHRLKAHNTLMWKNIDFSIEPGEHLEFLLINSGRWWTYGMAGVLGSAPLFLRVEKRSLQ